MNFKNILNLANLAQKNTEAEKMRLAKEQEQRVNSFAEEVVGSMVNGDLRLMDVEAVLEATIMSINQSEINSQTDSKFPNYNFGKILETPEYKDKEELFKSHIVCVLALSGKYSIKFNELDQSFKIIRQKISKQAGKIMLKDFPV